MTDRICAAVARASIAEALEAAEQETSMADVIEIRLDYLREIAVSPFLAVIGKPLLFTNRSGREAGSQASKRPGLLPS